MASFDQTAATTPNTTFVQADPSNFRAVVQKLTGASDNPSTPKLPLTIPSRLHHHRQTTTTTAAAAKKPLFKLHERRKKLEQLNIASTQQRYCNSSSSMTMFNAINMNMMNMKIISPYRNKQQTSPVSTLDGAAARGSPRSAEEEEEERVIAEKGFYLHPISPLSSANTPRSRGSDPPQLLPLFPLHSPNASSSSSHNINNNDNSS
ncbi:hypothetical protein HN51_026785 [Arachis hypogaea]|uniref:VQ motif-containing protein 11 n=1 Tax=Arachis hypogaea TaxID=3818 RepID=UPI000DECB78B|nr:VQ motif-containing protein 11 [Arachis hypogaea]QHO33003.1 VQ motif-containing protein [Arachis hypogaea]